CVFFFHHPAPPPSSPLSLHDALPISSGLPPRLRRESFAAVPHPAAPWLSRRRGAARSHPGYRPAQRGSATGSPGSPARLLRPPRSEEHTSELQSRENLVCRLLLEKKK